MPLSADILSDPSPDVCPSENILTLFSYHPCEWQLWAPGTLKVHAEEWHNIKSLIKRTSDDTNRKPRDSFSKIKVLTEKKMSFGFFSPLTQTLALQKSVGVSGTIIWALFKAESLDIKGHIQPSHAALTLSQRHSSSQNSLLHPSSVLPQDGSTNPSADWWALLEMLLSITSTRWFIWAHYCRAENSLVKFWDIFRWNKTPLLSYNE